MTTHENAEPLDGWVMPPRCCGVWVEGVVCGICSEYVRPLPDSIELGEN